MIDTISLSLPPRPGEQILGPPYPQLLAVQATRLIEPGELEPYRALLTEFIAEFEDGEGVTADLAIERPGHWNFTVPRFFHWLATTHPDRLTVPQGNTEGDPMTLTTDEIAALEAATDGVAETNALRDGRLEPYRALLTEYNLSRCDGADPAERATASMIELPSAWFVTLPQFFRWMRENHKVHPGHETSEPEVTTFHVGDRVRYVEHGLNGGLVGNERVVRTVDENRADLDHLEGGAANSGVDFDRLALVSCPHAGGSETTVPQGNGNDGAEWGPNHPEWDGWWERARSLAERFGYGSQYDALAEQLGGPSRVSYERVVVQIEFDHIAGEPIVRSDVRAALEDHGYSVMSRVPR